MKTNNIRLLTCGLILMLALVPLGCGSSGGGGSVTPASSVSTDQGTYDFGNVTVGKTATLQVIVHNTGATDLTVNDLTLSDLVNFSVDSNTCGSAPYTLPAGGDCTALISFSPTDEVSYSETLVVSSTDTTAPSYTVNLTGIGTPATALTVRLNQIDPAGCPDVKAFVTVTDQNGFRVDGLGIGDFLITENAGAGTGPDSVDLPQTASLSLATAIVMDYSLSVTADPAFVSAMETGATTYVNQMAVDDQGEIIKFGETVGVIQSFTTDKTLLQAAIPGLPNLGTQTALYDAIYQGIQDAAAAGPVARRVVIVLTDGVDYGGSAGVPGSVHTQGEVIALSQTLGIPVFTIGAGPDVDPVVLQDIADQTGGQYFEAPTIDRLVTIYAQLSEILNNQYVLTYPSTLTGAPVSVDVEVPSQPGLVGDISDPLTYAGCP